MMNGRGAHQGAAAMRRKWRHAMTWTAPMNDAPPVPPGTLWGVRCTDPDPIGHQQGRVCAQSQDRQRMWSLADGERCYELVVSADGGATWTAVP